MLETDAQTDFVEIRFAAGLPGFPHVHDFHLAPWGPPGSPYLLLRAVDDPDVGFVVVPPWVFYPDYEFDLDDATAEHLGLSVSPTTRSCSRWSRCAIVPTRRRSICSVRSS